jgi:hypothetical protein
MRLTGLLGAFAGRTAHVIAAGARVVARPIRAVGRVVRGGARQVTAGVRATASRARAWLEPLVAAGKRARLASSRFVKGTRSSARQVVAQARRALRDALRRSSRHREGTCDTAQESDGPAV